MDSRIFSFLLVIWIGTPIALGVDVATVTQVVVILDAFATIAKPKNLDSDERSP